MSSFKKQIPNFLSLSRIPFSLIIAYAIAINDGWLFFIFAFVGALTDWLDGYLARKWQAISRLGIILDPIADKIGIGIIIISLYIYSYVPLWLFITILAKDVFILLGGLLLKYKYHVVVPPANWAGKLATLVIAASLIIHFYQVEELIIIFQILTTAAILIVMFIYSQRFFILKNHLTEV
jgi:cardiolipin synthase